MNVLRNIREHRYDVIVGSKIEPDTINTNVSKKKPLKQKFRY